MKNHLIAFLVLLFMIPCLWGGSWNSTVNVGVELNPLNSDPYGGSFVFIDLYPSSDGLHLLLVDNDGVFYKNIDSEGNVDLSSTISSTSEVGAISANDEDVFVVYYESPYLKIKRSTNGGVNWASRASQSLTAYDDCDWVDIIADLEQNVVHVAWSDISEEVHYMKFDEVNNTWGSYKRVSSTGSGPVVEVSEDRLHISYTDSHDNIGEIYCKNMIREKNRDTSTWLTPQTINNQWGFGQGVFASDSLHMFYYDGIYDFGNPYLYHTTKSLTGTTWGSANQIPNSSLQASYSLDIAAFTDDGDLHLVYGVFTNGTFRS